MRISRVFLLIVLGLSGIQYFLDSKIESEDLTKLNSFNFIKTFIVAKSSNSPLFLWLKFVLQLLITVIVSAVILIALIKIYDPYILYNPYYQF